MGVVATPIEANYETYYAIKLAHYEYSWGGRSYGGTNNDGILVKDFPSEYLVSVPTTPTTSIYFLYPRNITPKAFLDGTAEGHFSIYNNSTTTEYSVSLYSVQILKGSDVPESTEVLGSYYGVISTDNSVATEDYLTLPFFIQIEEKELNADEKLILYLTFSSDDVSDDLCVGHENDSSIIDCQIKVPFAPEGY